MICGGHVSCILELSCMWTVVWPNGQMVECWHLTSMEEDIAIFRRYIAEISCIEGFRHDISWRNIGSAIFWYFSREIGDLAINRLFLAIYRAVNAGLTRYSARQRATVHALQCLHFLELRGFEPQTKRFGVHPLTT